MPDRRLYRIDQPEAGTRYRYQGSRRTALPRPLTWNEYNSYTLAPVTNTPRTALIMVVDDDVLERMGAAYMFSDAGYRVLEASNADEALQFFETNPDIRVLFTDVSMPGSIDGAGLARQIAERWPRIGVIMTSGRPRPDPLTAGHRFHAKPYQPSDVLRHAHEMTALPI
jgi:two-component system, response regulator PdtaR